MVQDFPDASYHSGSVILKVVDKGGRVARIDPASGNLKTKSESPFWLRFELSVASLKSLDASIGVRGDQPQQRTAEVRGL